jgi:hypothetical protein
MYNPILDLIYTVILVAGAAVLAFVAALYTNLILKTPPYHHLLSSTLITVGAFWLTGIICGRTLEPLLWFERDDTWRALLWEWRPVIIAAIVAVLCFSVWQFTVRRIRCRVPL